MKIYNEVTIDMNPESITYGKHLSEDSYEYNNAIDLCKGGDDGPPDPEPGYFWQEQPGGRLPQHLPSSYELPLGVGGSPIPGIAPSYKKTWDSFAAGVKGGNMDPWTGEPIPGAEEFNNPWDVPQEDVAPPGLAKGMASAMGRQRAKQQFFSHWYKPYYESMVSAPIRGMLGMDVTEGQRAINPGAQAIIDKVPSDFVRLSEAGIEPGIMEEFGSLEPGIRTAEAGYDEPIIADVFKSDVRQASDVYGMAKDAYDLALERIAGQEEEAEGIRKETLSDIRAQRLLSRRESVPDYERARAPMATSGIAYSQPAQTAMTGDASVQLEKNLGFKEQELAAESEYQEALGVAEESKEEAEMELDAKKLDFAGDLETVFQNTAQEALNLASQGSQIVGSHRAYGPSLIGKSETDIIGNPMNVWGTGEHGTRHGGSIFREQGPYELGLLQGVSGEAQTAAERLAEAARTAVLGLGTDEG